MPPEVALRVNGISYAGWERIRIVRGLEAVAGSFELAVSDRWNGLKNPWPIFEEDECVVTIDGRIVITGYVDRRSISYGSAQHTLTVSGRDKTGALVDCSASLTKWEYIGVPVVDLIRKVVAPFGIPVTLQAGVKLPKPPDRLTVDPGESAFEVIDRACRQAGLLPVSDGNGNLLLTQAGSTRAVTALIEGQNIKEASADYDATGRFRFYRLLSQYHGADGFSGEAAAFVTARSEDQGVRRQERVLLIRPEGGVNPDYAQKRAQWEASVRAARGDSISVTVQGWTQSDGTLWPLNALVPVRAPLLGINGDLLISQAIHTIDSQSGTLTQLTLRRPDAFKPEPVVPKPVWKELVGGV